VIGAAPKRTPAAGAAAPDGEAAGAAPKRPPATAGATATDGEAARARKPLNAEAVPLLPLA